MYRHNRSIRSRWCGAPETAAFNESPSLATVNGFGTLNVAAGAAT